MKSSNDFFFLNPGLALISFRTTWNLIMTEVALVDISNALVSVSHTEGETPLLLTSSSSSLFSGNFPRPLGIQTPLTIFTNSFLLECL